MDETAADPTEQVDPSADRPVLRVLTPDTSPEEIAALVAVVQGLAAAAAPPPAPPRRRSEWASPHRSVRSTPVGGPGAWRASALPR
jgi:Ser/Thr protein kinase RdoA (MazF antagonist)